MAVIQAYCWLSAGTQVIYRPSARWIRRVLALSLSEDDGAVVEPEMWSPPGLNVESYVEPLRSRRSGLVARTSLN